MSELTPTRTLPELVKQVNDSLLSMQWQSSLIMEAAHLIKSKEMWRATEATSFSHFCEMNGWTVRRLDQLAAGYAVLLTIPNETRTIVPAESQLRQLAKVPKKDRARVVTDAAKNGKVTAQSIKKAAEELSEEEQAKQDALSYLSNQAKSDLPLPVVVTDPVVVDELGWPIPAGIVGYWTRARETMKGLMSALSKVKCEIEKGRDDGDPVYLSLDQMTSGEINTSRYRIKIRMPYSVCTQCNGYPLINGSCELCGSTGFNLESDSTSNPKIGDVLKIRAAKLTRDQAKVNA